MNNSKFGFIGAGNMGGALAKALAKECKSINIMISDANTEKSSALAEELGALCTTNAVVANECDYIFLGVKPQAMDTMLSDINDVLKNRKTPFVLISMAAGLSCNKILSAVGGNYPIIRIMPNIPVSVGEGMILYSAENTTPEQISVFLSAMRSAGRLDRIDEHLIDAASAISGCGPAFVYMFIQSLADGAVECGIPRAKALEYAAQTVLGAAKTVLDEHRHPEELKDAVCSPGGTTIAGVHALENGGFRALSMDAVKSSYETTLKLANK